MSSRRRNNTRGGENGARVPPSDLRAEESLLGAALLARAALEVLATETRPDSFYRPAHQAIAHALTVAYAEGIPADPVTIGDVLNRDGLLDQVGGVGVLVDLQGGTPATSNAGAYAKIVEDLAALRRLITQANEIAELGYSMPADVAALAVRAREMLEHAVPHANGNGHSSLEVADVAAIISGTIELEEPVLLARSDGGKLLYAGRIHDFHGEPSSGKSWLALVACLEVLELGGAAVYLDYEDAPRGIVNRLLALGADAGAVAERFVYVKPGGAFGLAERAELDAILARLNPDIAVIDGVAEALARDNLSEDRATEYAQWVERLARPLADTGASVLLLDHVAKDREQRGRYSRGSGHKLASVTGSSFEIRVLSGFSRTRAGRLKLVISKDRHGAIGEQGATAAMVTIEPHALGAQVSVRLDPPEVGSPAAPWRPTRLMARASETIISSSAPLTMTGLETLLAGATKEPKLLRSAVEFLVKEGYVARQGGRVKYLRSLRPYHDEEGNRGPPEETAPADTTDAGLFAEWPGVIPDADAWNGGGDDAET